MKRNKLYALCGIFLLASCQQEETPSTEGGLSVAGIEKQVSAEVGLFSRAVDKSLTVDLYKGGEKLRTLTAKEMQSKIKLDAASDYSLKVYSANYGSDVNWTNEQKGEPIYYKEEPFSVKLGETTSLKVKVPMSNYAVKLVLPEGLDWVSSSEFTVTSGERSVKLQNGETAYFPYAEGGSFTYQLNLTNADNETFELTGSYGTEENKKLAFNTCYEVAYSMATQSLQTEER